jgi:hypothetical protein
MKNLGQINGCTLLKEKILTFMTFYVLVNHHPDRELIHESLRTEIERSLETLNQKQM